MQGPVTVFTGRLGAARMLAAVIESFDAVIARMPSETGLLGAALARKFKKRLLIELAGCTWDGLWNYGSWKAKLYAPVRFWRVRRAVRLAPFVLYVSRIFLPRRYPTHGISACVSDVEIPFPNPVILSQRERRIHGARDPFILGLIGRLDNKTKGIQTAINALAEYKGKIPNFELRILGEGDPEQWQKLVRQHELENRVRFCGTVPSGQPVRDWLDDVDLYLQPSFQEGLPRALVEAMSRACPAIGSTAGGIPELLPPEYLFRPGDAAELSRLICEISSDTERQTSLAQRNFQVAQGFSSNILNAQRTAFWKKFTRFYNEPPG